MAYVIEYVIGKMVNMPSAQKMKDSKVDMYTTSNDTVICIVQLRLLIIITLLVCTIYNLPLSVMRTFIAASGFLALTALKNSS